LSPKPQLHIFSALYQTVFQPKLLNHFKLELPGITKEAGPVSNKSAELAKY
jgi:hypothetical protein